MKAAESVCKVPSATRASVASRMARRCCNIKAPYCSNAATLGPRF
jgi:hypothetical protein